MSGSAFFATVPYDAGLSLIAFPFHSLHASMSGQGIHHVCICLKSIWSTYWKVCIRPNILSLVHFQVIKESLFGVAHITSFQSKLCVQKSDMSTGVIRETDQYKKTQP